MINLPVVQTKIAQKTATYLSEELGNEVYMDQISIRFFDEVSIKNLYISDLNSDTLLFAERITVNVGLLNILTNQLHFDKISIYKGNIELKKAEEEKSFNYQFLVDYFKGSPNDSSSSKWEIELNRIELANTSFSYYVYHEEDKKGVNFNDISAKSLALDFDNIRFQEDTIRFMANKIKFKEQSGFQLINLQGETEISPAGISLENMKIRTLNSLIDADLSFSTDSFSDFNSFNEKVEFLFNFNLSRLYSVDLAYFVPELLEMRPQTLDIDGHVRGKVNNLKGRDILMTLNNSSTFAGNFDLKGLPVIEETFMYLSVDQILTKAEYLSQLPTVPFHQNGSLKVPEFISKMGEMKFSGKFTGFLSDFVAYGQLTSVMGKVSTDLSVKGQGDDLKYIGTLQSGGFNLGKFIQNEDRLGQVSMNLEVNGKGASLESMKALINGKIYSIEINRRKFKNILLKGEIANELFNGDITIKDELLDMDFIGSIDLRGKLPELNFIAQVNELHLGRIIDYKTIDTSALVSTTVNIDVIGNDIDNLIGKVELFGSIYQDDNQLFNINHLELNANRTDSGRSLILSSDLVDAELRGMFKLEELAGSFRSFINKYIPAIVGEEYANKEINEDFSFDVHYKNTELLSRLLFPAYTLDSGANMHGNYNSTENQLVMDFDLNGGNLNGIELEPGKITVNTKENTMFMDARFEAVGLGKGLRLDELEIKTETEDNKALIGVNWENTSSSSKGKININTEFVDLANFVFTFNNSSVLIADTLWTIPNNSSVRIDSNSLSFDNFSLSTAREMIEIDGKVSVNPEDVLNFRVNNFDMSLFNLIIPEKSIELDGRISGSASIKDPYHNLIFTSNVDFTDFKINNNLMGNGSVKSFWLNEMDVLHVDGNIMRGNIPTIKISGNYFPKLEENNINMSLSLQNTYLQLFQPYVNGTLSNLRGLINGKVNMSGSLKTPVLTGSLQLQKAGFTVDYLNTSYSFSDKIIIRPDWIGFDHISVFDSKQGKALVTGTVFHDNFKDFNTDVFIQADKFHCLNTTLADNELYFGQAFVTGEVDISGFADNLIIDMDVQTTKSNPLPKGGAQPTIFSIPLNTQSDLTENQFIRFIDEQSKSKRKVVLPQANLKGIQMNFNLDITPDAEVRLIFDEKVGDILKGKGNGNLNLEINTNGDFNIFGEYTIDEGDYLFTLQNIINKKFSLERGGKISWNGDPYAGVMDITAKYRTRARLSDIIITPDSNSNYTKRNPVELLLTMQNTILSPDISFDINLPNADENTKGLLRNVLYVGNQETNENIMNKQAFSLLILNRFTPPEQGISGAGFGATSSSEVLSNQLSNWLSQISKDVDLGFAYRPGDELSNDEVELFVSAEIFNDRVVVSGNFEYGGSQTVNQSQNTNNLVGEGSVEYKIREDGKFRVKAFNKANNNNFLENNNPYTQGVGLSYRQEFNYGKEFFRSIFVRKKKRDVKD